MKDIVKRLLKFVIIAVLSLPTLPAFADESVENSDNAQSLLTRIEEESGGNIIFEIPENIESKIFSVPTAPKKIVHTPAQRGGRHGVSKQNGFRIQVFNDGRNQGSLQARAKARGNAIVSRFPKYRGQVYTFSSAPNWFTRVGNFRTQAEANSAMAELKRAFPQFASEMRVVKCQVTIVR
ncbi:MAG: SPOR domain-containing protein [Clostridium sp.]|nr:SPOR domain-containing protein [Prevotella sp.]MCM1428786.1 SPOR domain-containing protein [Clostridium sp.]MCM1475161.1 SPOR domain-containing protein [Muribaculaceae bacterium]